jgi:hypothetical protein
MAFFRPFNATRYGHAVIIATIISLDKPLPYLNKTVFTNRLTLLCIWSMFGAQFPDPALLFVPPSAYFGSIPSEQVKCNTHAPAIFPESFLLVSGNCIRMPSLTKKNLPVPLETVA